MHIIIISLFVRKVYDLFLLIIKEITKTTTVERDGTPDTGVCFLLQGMGSKPIALLQ